MLLALPIAERLRSARHVLIAGAGGGFDALAGHLHYRDLIEHSRTPMDVSLAIEAYREGVAMRPRRAIPH